MKIYNLLIAFFALFILVSCEENEYEVPNSFSDVAWVNGFAPGEEWAVNINNPHAFMDLSRGAITHKWTIEQGNYFIEPEYDDRTDSIFTQYIIGEDTISEEQLISVLFTKPGLSKVHLHNTFPDSVSWWGSNALNATKQGNEWVIDTTFMIDVFDTIRNAFNIFKGDELLHSIKGADVTDINDTASWPVLNIESGESLTFVDMTVEGRPSARNWNLKGSDRTSSNDSSFTVAYYFLGNNLAGKHTSKREWPYPLATVVKHIPLKINVGPSSQPFTIVGNVSESQDETISFSVTGVLTTCTGEEDNFVVHVENTDAGYSADIPVKSASINPSNTRQIDLKLSAPIYNSDVITITYNGGNIRSVDERVLESFTNKKVNMHYVNAISSDVFGFELPHGNENDRNIANGWWLQHPPYMIRSDEQAASGSYSLKIETDTHGANYTLHGADMKGDVSPPAGTYMYKAKVWKAASTTATGLRVNLTPWLLNVLDIGSVNAEEWVTFERKITVSDPITKITVQLNTADSDGGAQLLYLDDIQLLSVETR